MARETGRGKSARERLTHLDEKGKARMVDVSGKRVTTRTAEAGARVLMKASTLRLILEGGVEKGDVLAVARVAGIMAAKRTAELIPLCHSLPLDGVSISFRTEGVDTIQIEAEARATARTGVEMEALVAVTVAALTVYDMCKAVDRGMVIESVCLEEKSGGRSGHYVRRGP